MTAREVVVSAKINKDLIMKATFVFAALACAALLQASTAQAETRLPLWDLHGAPEVQVNRPNIGNDLEMGPETLTRWMVFPRARNRCAHEVGAHFGSLFGPCTTRWLL